MIPVISIIASSSNSGKTTVLCDIIFMLKSKGYKVATLKHDSHGFEIDHPGKDTWKHRKAGSDIVMISSPNQFAMIETVENEYTLNQIISKITDVDIILTEGYKNMDKPKIEIFREGVSKSLIANQDELFAIVSNSNIGLETNVPVFSFEELDKLVMLIEAEFLS